MEKSLIGQEVVVGGHYKVDESWYEIIKVEGTVAYGKRVSRVEHEDASVTYIGLKGRPSKIYLQ